jgi:heme-degrading monooxygenase HmoA
MIVEVVMAEVRPSTEADYVSAFREASTHLRTVPGYVTHDLRRSLETPHRFGFTITWESVEAHMVGFRNSPQYQQWKRLLHRFYDPFPVVEHYETIALTEGGGVDG